MAEDSDKKFKLSVGMIILLGLGAIVATFFVLVAIRQNMVKSELADYKAELRAKGFPTNYMELEERQRNRLIERGLDPEEMSAFSLVDKLNKLLDLYGANSSDFNYLSDKLDKDKSITHDPKLKALYDKHKTLVQDVADEMEQKQNISCRIYGSNKYPHEEYEILRYNIGLYTEVLSYFMHYHAGVNPELAAEDIILIFKASYLLRDIYYSLRYSIDRGGVEALRDLLGQCDVSAESLGKIKNVITGQIPTFSFRNNIDMIRILIFKDWKDLIYSGHRPIFFRYITTFGYTTTITAVLRALQITDKIQLSMPTDSLVGYNYDLVNEREKLLGGGFLEDEIHGHFQFLARMHAAASAIDVMLFKQKFGRLPNDATELEEKMAVTISNDPFVASKLIYKKTKTGFVIYSVGPNKIDDGGIYNPGSKKDDATFEVKFNPR